MMDRANFKGGFMRIVAALGLLAWIPAFAGMTGRLGMAGMAWGQQPVAVYEITDFSGGMVTDYDGVDLPSKYGGWSYNFSCNKGRLEMRPGLDSLMHLSGLVLDVFKFTVSEPNLYGYYGLDSLNKGEILVKRVLSQEVSGTPPYTDSIEVEKFYMYPKYTQIYSYAVKTGLWTGVWDNTEFNDVGNAPGRTRRLRSSGLEYMVANGALHAAAGSYAAPAPFPLKGTNYDYPWWFGYIGRYQWRADSALRIDDFYLYEASLFKPDTIINWGIGNGMGVLLRVGRVDTLKSGISTWPKTTFGATNGEPVGQGRYWIKIAYEYDGFQYSTPVGDSNMYVDVNSPGTSIINIPIVIDTTEIRKRVTAVLVFTSDSIQQNQLYHGTVPYAYVEWNFWQQAHTIETRYGPGMFQGTAPSGDQSKLPMFLRKRVVISDSDTSNLGYWWHRHAQTGDGYKFQWTSDTLNYKYIYLFLDNDDFGQTCPEMYEFLGHSSDEAIVLPEHCAMVQNQQWAGNVLIDAPDSKIHERHRNLVVISPWGQPDVLPINNFIQCGAGSGSYVTAIKEWNGNALVWTNDAFEIWTPGAAPQRLEQFVGMGCTVPRSVQVTPQGVFYANSQAIYHYTGQGIPQMITPLIETVYDSIRGFINNDNSGPNLHTLPFAASAYLPSLQQYLFVYDSSYAGLADTSYSLPSYSWGSHPPGRWYGGRTALVYDIVNRAWSKVGFPRFLRQFITDGNGNVNALDGIYSNLYQYPTTIYDESIPSCRWSSGWTDLGDSREKEITAVELDYELNWKDTTGKPDTIRLIVFADGKTAAVDTLDFFPADSASSAIHWRKVKSVTATPWTVTDPARRAPVEYRFDLYMGGALSTVTTSADAFGRVNSMRVYYMPRQRRQ